jgi:hypothetical protein
LKRVENKCVNRGRGGHERINMEIIKDEEVRGDEAAARRRDRGKSVQAIESKSMRRGERG